MGLASEPLWTRESMKASSREGRLNSDRRAVGGFQESMVAMMMVVAGVTILAATMAMLPADLDVGGTDPSRLAVERIITDERWTLSPGVLRYDEIDEMTIRLEDIGGAGCRAVLQEVGGATVVLFEGGEVGGGGERFASSRAVNVHHGPQEVKAATVTVWVWT